MTQVYIILTVVPLHNQPEVETSVRTEDKWRIQVDSPRGQMASLKLNDLRWHNETRPFFYISKSYWDKLPFLLSIFLEIPLELVQAVCTKETSKEKKYII